MKRKRDRGAAIFVAMSANHKTGPVAVTYASIAATCPRACPLRGAGCYAQTGRVGILETQLQKEGVTALAAAAEEARQIEVHRPPRGLPLRLHVSGDARTSAAAARLGKAAWKWRSRGGGAVWTYTHAWRKVPRSAWGRSVSVLGSIERAVDARAVVKQGYAPALVVAELPADGRAWVEEGIRWIPCPEMTRGVPCAQCGLCFRADALRARGAGIAFAAHSVSKKRVLKVIG